MAEPASTFPELLARAVAARPDHPALITSDGVLTYAELDGASATMARALLATGAGKGTRIGLLAPDGALWLTTFYAALRIGALVTPISTLAAPPELAQILRTGDIQVLIGVRSFLRRDFATLLPAAVPGLASSTAGALGAPEAPYLRTVWLDDPAGLPWARSVDELLATADEPVASDPTLLAAVERAVTPADDAFVVHTSGSTATPKAVVHSHRSVARQPGVLASYFGITADDRTMPLLPAFWMGGIAYALQALSTGSTLVYPASPAIDDVLDMVEQHDVTCLIVWHMFAKLRAAAVERGIDIDRVRGLGSPPRDADGERIPTRRRSNPLGMSESFAIHSAEPIGTALPDDKVGAAGRAVNGIERRVVDRETGEELPSGELGELQLRGGALMRGFYGVPRDQVFTPDGWYPTGDLVRIDADGYAYFVGRTGDMIKTNAANVSRLEVEAALNALPDVELSLVAGLPDDELGEVVAAAVVPAAGASPTEDELRTALRERLSSFKIPRTMVFITHDDVPRTSTGKVQLFELRGLIESRRAAATATSEELTAG
ncbi:MAG: acyl--CoA ligase [Actinomycetota bacterium]|nr:acyl--CoA ligase [Actinomycetota bacterium]